MNYFPNVATFFASAFVSVTAFGIFASATPSQLASHQAVYDLKLEELNSSGGIDAVRGRIVLRIEQQCEGMIMNQRMVLEMVNAEGGVVVSDYLLSTWEDQAGNVMRFDMSNRLNGQVVEKFKGVAERGENTASVTFTEPEPEEMQLPAAVIFPVDHTRKILEAAKAGKNLMSAKVFDGNGAEGLSDTLAVIGKRRMLSDPTEILAGLQDMTYWPLQLSFFDLREQANEPDYEVGMKMFENGVATDLMLKYQDFSLSGKVSRLEFLEAEKCS